jgi:putative transposase
MSRAPSPSRGRTYGIARVCRAWGVARATVYRHRGASAAETDPQPPLAPVRRRGPIGACPDAELAAHVAAEIEASPFGGEGYRKIWARLRHKGIRTAARRVRRLMKEHGLQAPHRVRPSRQHAHDGTIVTERVDEIWGTDMTQTVTTEEGRAYLFVAVDHCSGEIVGIHAARSASRFEALEPVRQGVATHFGDIAAGVAQGLTLRHDHGSNYMADDFQREIGFLGIASSPAFVRQPEGNGVAERTIRTLKENLLWVRGFATLEALRQGLLHFAALYNARWLRERHGYKTPNQIRAEQRRLETAAGREQQMAA